MKPFNLEEALKGKRVVNYKGNEITQIHKFDVKSDFSIGGVLSVGNYVGAWRPSDLFMASEKKDGWVNMYKSKLNGNADRYCSFFATKELADEPDQSQRIACVKVEWEE